jgi:hypothetical protein
MSLLGLLPFRRPKSDVRRESEREKAVKDYESQVVQDQFFGFISMGLQSQAAKFLGSQNTGLTRIIAELAMRLNNLEHDKRPSKQTRRSKAPKESKPPRGAKPSAKRGKHKGYRR